MEETTQEVQEGELQPAPVAPPEESQDVTLEMFCRSVAHQTPVETLSLFYTLESSKERLRDTYEGFAGRLQELANSPIG
jgi:hypothetical protein